MHYQVKSTTNTHQLKPMSLHYIKLLVHLENYNNSNNSGVDEFECNVGGEIE
jgi:hypothetical protein